MYDVIYIDAQGTETPLAQHVADRETACALAREAAAERSSGRAMLPGSTNLRDCVCVVPTPPLSAAA
ncbi:MAG TPA: hypothetical protein VD836_11950 [Solirubrobacteraceae bacterium]|nr:hypothetical protein [Solirubrobacteraceae bacterium]